MAAGPQLELDRDDRFHRIEWWIQRLGWATIGLVLVAALFGLFGSAYSGARQVASADGTLQVDYLRFARYRLETSLTVRALSNGGDFRIWLPVTYLERMNLQRVEPQPRHVAAGVDVHVFTFARASPNAQAVFHFKPDRFGRVDGRLGVIGGGEVEFRQRIYP